MQPGTTKTESLRMRVHGLMTDYHPLDILEMMEIIAAQKMREAMLKGEPDDAALDEFIGKMEQAIAAAENLEWNGIC